MSTEKLGRVLASSLEELRAEGVLKGREKVVTGFVPAAGRKGPRWRLEGEGDRDFLRMNSNSYLGLSLNPEVLGAGEEASRLFGAGPGAVRFISGTSRAHVDLERGLASFHGRESAMIFSAAYSAVMGVLPSLITGETVVFSDELNHNCIISALRLARPLAKVVYPHLEVARLERELRSFGGRARRALVVTDGVFSMRGDHAPLGEIEAACRRHESLYEEGVTTVVDDSHGIGAFGRTGRGTEEQTGARADVLVATLGKALGVNGGYVASSAPVIAYLRERSPFYVYSNPVTPGEAGAAAKALAILDGPEGAALLARLRSLTERLREGLRELKYETISGDHPIVPLMVRDSGRTSRLVGYLLDRGVLATGLNYPVVPRGDEEVRFQVTASHSEGDIDYLIEVLREFREGEGQAGRGWSGKNP